MMTAHQQGTALVAVYAKDIAETKAQEACDMARQEGHPLMLSTEPEE
jgi:ATP-dependent Clp protease adaptor protein ClpS